MTFESAPYVDQLTPTTTHGQATNGPIGVARSSARRGRNQADDRSPDPEDMKKCPNGGAVGAFVRANGPDQLIANTTVTVAETSCEPGWIGVAASAAANRPGTP
jgi:hypothetical protein